MNELEVIPKECQEAINDINFHRGKSIEHIMLTAKAVKRLYDIAPPSPTSSGTMFTPWVKEKCNLGSNQAKSYLDIALSQNLKINLFQDLPLSKFERLYALEIERQNILRELGQ
jgi:hypothetical protein